VSFKSAASTFCLCADSTASKSTRDTRARMISGLTLLRADENERDRRRFRSPRPPGRLDSMSLFCSHKPARNKGGWSWSITWRYQEVSHPEGRLSLPSPSSLPKRVSLVNKLRQSTKRALFVRVPARGIINRANRKSLFALEKARKLADRAKPHAKFGHEPSAVCRVEN
jgi:hypothetical protein